MVMVGVVSPPAAVSVVCAADTVMAVGLITWLERVAMVPRVVMGVAREALVLWPPAPARLVETVPVTVPRVVTPGGEGGRVGVRPAAGALPLPATFPLVGPGHGQMWSTPQGNRRLGAGTSPTERRAQHLSYTPVVPFTTNVVTAGLTAETVTGVTRRTPPMGTVRRMVPGCPGAPFSTTWNARGKRPHVTPRLPRPCAAPSRAPQEDTCGLLGSWAGHWGEGRARHASPESLLAARGQWRF